MVADADYYYAVFGGNSDCVRAEQRDVSICLCLILTLSLNRNIVSSFLE